MLRCRKVGPAVQKQSVILLQQGCLLGIPPMEAPSKTLESSNSSSSPHEYFECVVNAAEAVVFTAKLSSILFVFKSYGWNPQHLKKPVFRRKKKNPLKGQNEVKKPSQVEKTPMEHLDSLAKARMDIAFGIEARPTLSLRPIDHLTSFKKHSMMKITLNSIRPKSKHEKSPREKMKEWNQRENHRLWVLREQRMQELYKHRVNFETKLSSHNVDDTFYVKREFRGRAQMSKENAECFNKLQSTLISVFMKERRAISMRTQANREKQRLKIIKKPRSLEPVMNQNKDLTKEASCLIDYDCFGFPPSKVSRANHRKGAGSFKKEQKSRSLYYSPSPLVKKMENINETFGGN